MNDHYMLKKIAVIRSDFPTKFGIPRQSGVVDTLEARIVFDPEYRNPDALRGMEEYSHIWLIWQFSEAVRDTWSPTVRPPKLGGNVRKGVFATRSPFRPNALGLSCVQLKRVIPDSPEGPVLVVTGADLMDGTPIYDIKPYIPYADAHPDARESFTADTSKISLSVEDPTGFLTLVPEEKRESLIGVLSQDPRPGYQKDPDRVYGFPFAGFEVKFRVKDETVILCGLERELPEESCVNKGECIVYEDRNRN
ncbi:MAG: tRNA (N6-threonylcarbamoyladenosine(37)-N6)-methyltransferase TrmO [Lachnospiraceae bacterium]|nr:tRNA (N6-threonylcarbamoyladenosine(37)-N6)-methyltransferase TrmO [Lachnospiraceae bacterium]